MKNTLFKRAIALLLALVCVMGILPLSAFADNGRASAPSYITQKSAVGLRVNGHAVRYPTANATVNHSGLAYVFDAQVEVEGMSAPVRALCSYHDGFLNSAFNGQKWNYSKELTHPSLKALLTWVYSSTYGNFTDAGNARGLETWPEMWSYLWFVVAQGITWYDEYGVLIDCTTDREGFIRQVAEEMVATFKMFHDTWNSSAWITDWDSVDIRTIIDSNDNGATGNSAYDYASTAINLVLDHPEYFHNYHIWDYEWDSSQPWLMGGSPNMQRLLIAIPDEQQQEEEPVKLTVKKLEAGANTPIPGVAFKVENAVDPALFSVTRTTGADGTFTLTDADGLTPGQFKNTEESAPAGYVAQTESQVVTIMPGGSANSTFTFYNQPDQPIGGDGSIRKVDADNPTVGIPGAVIRITSVKLDDGGSFVGEYTTGDGGYISKEDLDFSKLPTGSYVAEEITPPEGFILSSDVAKVKQAFVWDGEHDISLIFGTAARSKSS